MLCWILERTKMASLAGKWADAASLDPGDKGQTAVMASALMKQSGKRTRATLFVASWAVISQVWNGFREREA